MAKSDAKVNQYRMDGMAYAYELARDKGVDALKDEIERRKAVFVPLEMSRDYVYKVLSEMEDNLNDFMAVCACMALHDEFGFSTKRLERFVEKYNYLAKCSMELDKNGEHYVRVSDFAEFLNENCGAQFNVEKIKEIERRNENE